MILVSLLLVGVAAIALVVGVLGDVLALVHVSIGTCLAAVAVLGVGLARHRRESSPASFEGDEATSGPPSNAIAGPGEPSSPGDRVGPVEPGPCDPTGDGEADPHERSPRPDEGP